MDRKLHLFRAFYSLQIIILGRGATKHTTHTNTRIVKEWRLGNRDLRPLEMTLACMIWASPSCTHCNQRTTIHHSPPHKGWVIPWQPLASFPQSTCSQSCPGYWANTPLSTSVRALLTSPQLFESAPTCHDGGLNCSCSSVGAAPCLGALFCSILPGFHRQYPPIPHPVALLPHPGPSSRGDCDSLVLT